MPLIKYKQFDNSNNYDKTALLVNINKIKIINKKQETALTAIFSISLNRQQFIAVALKT